MSRVRGTCAVRCVPYVQVGGDAVSAPALARRSDKDRFGEFGSQNSFPPLRLSERWFATVSIPDQVHQSPAAIVDGLVVASKTKFVQDLQRRDVPCPHG